MIRLKYGNTNTFLVPGRNGYLLVDTDYAGTLQAFYKAIKQYGIQVRDISYVLATHYHPDHIGLIPELMKQGVKLLLMDTQKEFVHYSDIIFARDGLPFTPIDGTEAVEVTCNDSRSFLEEIGIAGEIISTPSHSQDSVSVLLDTGDCIVGDLEPIDFLEAYPEKCAQRDDWENILRFHPQKIYYAHANEKIFKIFKNCRRDET